MKRYLIFTISIAAVFLLGCKEPGPVDPPSDGNPTPGPTTLWDFMDDPEFANLDLTPLRENRIFGPAVSGGKKDTELIRDLYELVKGQKVLGYDLARTRMYDDYTKDGGSYKGIDSHRGRLKDYYSGREIPAGSRTEVYRPGYFNCEHSWPKSQFRDTMGDENDPAYCDLHHLFSSDESANSARSVYEFGNAVTIQETFKSGNEPGSSLGRDAAGKTVFQVRADRRGDMARAHFYMAVRYSQGAEAIDDNDNGDSKTGDVLGTRGVPLKGLSDGRLNDIEEAVLRQWHRDDPVSLREVIRNQRIEEAQGNRNPFVDYPELVDRISDF